MFLPTSRAQAGTVIHLVNPMKNAFGGSENRTLELARLLSAKATVHVWSPRKVAPELKSRVRIRRIRAPFWYPCGGTVVFVGAYFRLGSWLKLLKPYRLILIHNTPDLANLEDFLASLKRAGIAMQPEIVYAAAWMREMTRPAWPGPHVADRFVAIQARESCDTTAAAVHSGPLESRHRSEAPSRRRSALARDSQTRGSECA